MEEALLEKKGWGMWLPHPLPPFSILSSVLVDQESILLQFIWGKRAPYVCCETCHLLRKWNRISNIRIRHHTLHRSFLVRMWERRILLRAETFPTLKNVYSDNFYHECRHAPKVFFRFQTGLSNSQLLSSRALYRMLVRAGHGSSRWSALIRTRQETFFCTSCNFIRMGPLWWYRGVDRSRLLSLLGRSAIIQTSWRLHRSRTEWKILCLGS